MSILVNIPNRNIAKLIERLAEDIPRDEIQIYPDVLEKGQEAIDRVEFALVWKHDHGTLNAFGNLKAISSFGAGVDSLLSDSELPNVPIARIVDPSLATDMAKFLVTTIQQHKLRFAQFRQQQKEQLWKPKSKRKGNRVGILGLGQLGTEVATLLKTFGFEVAGWSRTQKQIAGIDCFSEESGFNTLLNQSDYLVCLLPLTEQTKGILNTKVFESLPDEAVVINVARGEHLVEQDLINALDSGLIDAAYLDVFTQEPLPKQHPFWQHEKITITPHISAVTNLETAVTQIVENYYRVVSQKDGRSIKNEVDLALGY